MAGIAQSFGVQPDRYVRLDFNGFVHLIDAVGGVSIYVENPITDYNYPTEDFGVTTVEFPAGWQHMDGERALIYARTRHADDDYRRAERQQQVVSALLGKMILPIYWPGVVGALLQSVDTDLNVLDLAMLAPPVLLNGVRGERLVIDRDYITATADGVAVPDYALIAPWLDVYFE
jgi:anionic cell wall polymer biosynthesis LytR-Cps2A-Psr (LCP) family protein